MHFLMPRKAFFGHTLVGSLSRSRGTLAALSWGKARGHNVASAEHRSINRQAPRASIIAPAGANWGGSTSREHAMEESWLTSMLSNNAFERAGIYRGSHPGCQQVVGLLCMRQAARCAAAQLGR